jgi:hypothetical protein
MHLGFTVFFTAVVHVFSLIKELKGQAVHPFEEQFPECFASGLSGLG